MPIIQPDPKYFDWGNNMLATIQQGRENQRQNALLELDKQQQGRLAEQHQFSMDESRRQQTQQAEQEAGKQRLAALQWADAQGLDKAGTLQIVPEARQSFEQEHGPGSWDTVSEEDFAKARRVGIGKAAAALGIGPPQPPPVSQSAEMQAVRSIMNSNPGMTEEQALDRYMKLQEKYKYHAPSQPPSPGFGQAQPGNKPDGTPGFFVVDNYGNQKWLEGQPKPEKSQYGTREIASAKGISTNITLARKQISNIKKLYEELKGTTAIGKWQGLAKGPRTEKFDAAVYALQTTIRKMTRTAGEGSMSDWEGRLSQAQLPSSNDWEDTIPQKIQQLTDMVDIIDAGAKDILSSVPSTPKAFKEASEDQAQDDPLGIR